MLSTSIMRVSPSSFSLQANPVPGSFGIPLGLAKKFSFLEVSKPALLNGRPPCLPSLPWLPFFSALGSAAGIGVRRMTSWVELVVFPGA